MKGLQAVLLNLERRVTFHSQVYLVVLIMGVASFVLDAAIDWRFAVDTLAHMPWELFSFVTGAGL